MYPFNKLTPFKESSLKEKINDFSKIGYSINNIFVIDGSKRSTKANAFFRSWSEKTIALYDTLLEKHSDEELVAVLAMRLGTTKETYFSKFNIINNSNWINHVSF